MFYRICPPHFTTKFFEKLSKFKFTNKINSFEFRLVNTEFNPVTFCTFLQDVFDENADFVLTFVSSSQIKNQLLPRVKEIISGWDFLYK